MRRLLPLVALILMVAGLPLNLNAQTLSKDLQKLEQFYNNGSLAELRKDLPAAKAKTDEEQAFLIYLNALLKTSAAESIPLLDQAVSAHPGTHYGQLCMLERAKIHLLERQIEQAELLLQKISAASILERYYWLSLCADARDDYERIISNAQSYLRLDPRGTYAESAWYLIAGAYQKQGKFQSAITSLNKLAALEGYPQRKQYFHYFLGLLYKQAGNPAEAARSFRQGYEINRNSQLALQIEDELIALKAKHPSSVDLGSIYPYPRLNIVPAPADTLAAGKILRDDKTPLKLAARPGGGYFVQAGRFGQEANASKLTTGIRELRLAANYYEDSANKTTPWVVVSGPYTAKSEADEARQLLLSSNIDCFITQF